MINFYKGYLTTKLNEGEAATTITLDRVTNLNGEAMTTSDFADFGRGILTVNPDGDGLVDFPENISFTTVNGTTFVLGGAIRGLDKSGASQTDLMYYHPVGTPVVISFGVHNITDLKDYIDDAVAAASFGTNVVAVATAGETVAQGNLVYLNIADGQWWKAIGSSNTTIDRRLLGIAQGAGTAGAAITGGVMTSGLDTHQTGLTAGSTCYASDTSGLITTTPGTFARVVGIAKSTTSINFDPYINQGSTFQVYYAQDTAASDAYTATIPGLGAYRNQTIFLKVVTANTGACTLNVNGLGAKDIKTPAGGDPVTGNILAGQIISLTYNGTSFQITGGASSAPTVQIFTTTGAGATWTKPSGLSAVIVEVVGGGGGGGGSSNTGRAGGGGGAGGYARKRILAATLGATETVVAGAGGAGGGSGASVAGSTSSFGTHVTATGGAGGSSAGNVGAGGAGGVGASGDLNAEGGDGGYGYEVGTPSLVIGGAGGNSYFGAGAPQVIELTAINTGTAGNLYGGGGSGSSNTDGTDTTGGTGAQGVVIVTEFY